MIWELCQKAQNAMLKDVIKMVLVLLILPKLNVQDFVSIPQAKKQFFVKNTTKNGKKNQKMTEILNVLDMTSFSFSFLIL